MMRFVYALLLLSSYLLFAGTVQAACVTGAPNGSTLDIYGDPLANRPVIGGVSVGQCTLEVTSTCSGDFCQVFLGSLSGWADMRFVSVNASEQSNSRFIYEITGGGGTVTLLGITQPTPVEPGGKVIFTLLDNGTMRLTLPPESQMADIIMQRTGSSSFTGSMPDWAGFPIKVEVIAEPVSAPKAILDFISNDPKAKMQMSMNLSRTNNPKLTTTLNQTQPANQQTSNQPNGQSANAANSANCQLAADVSAAMGIEERNASTGIYQNILDRVGIDFQNPTDRQCQAVLDASLNEGVLCYLVNTVGLPPNFAWGPVQINANGGTINRIPARFCQLSQAQGRGQPGTSKIKEPGSSNVPTQNPRKTVSQASSPLCDALLIAVGPILREGNGSVRRSQLMDVLRSVGVFDLTTASTGVCRQVGIDLVRVGLLVEGQIDLYGESQQGGEDPNTMIEGGVEILNREQNRAPAKPSNNQQANVSSGTQSTQAQGSGISLACIAFADQVMKIISFGSSADVSILQIVLSDSGMTQITGKSDQDCQDAEALLFQRGLVR